MQLFRQIILDKAIQKIFDCFAMNFSVRVLFYSLDGTILTNALNLSNSVFCDLMQCKIFGRSACLQLDRAKRLECMRLKKGIRYTCHAGIEEIIQPVFVGSEIVGFAMIGQIRVCENPSPELLREAQKKSVGSEVVSAFKKLPMFSEQKLNAMIELFEMLIDYIASKEIIHIKGDRVTAIIIEYLEENIQRNVSLPEAAKLVSRSPSSISHLFKKNLGQSFKRCSTELKLAHADKLFRINPKLSVAEVADSLGFEDPYYFSRIYRKYRGYPPSQAGH